MNGDVQVVLNAQRDQEHVILDDMQYWMNDQVGKDCQLMMRFPKGQCSILLTLHQRKKWKIG